MTSLQCTQHHVTKSSTSADSEFQMLKSSSIGDELEILEKDREIHTDPNETRRRRAIKLHKEKGSWGFTLQTYGIKSKRTNTLEVMTYVDYVEIHGSASFAGMRKGDVILSVNGKTVESLTHKELVAKIQESSNVLRLVVLFEDCCRKVELYDRFIKLKKLLSLKQEELRILEYKERAILQARGIARLSSLRHSSRSSTSSDWDRFSVVSPSALQSTPNTRLWRELSFPSMSSQPSYSIDNSADDLSLCNDSFSEDSDAFLSSSNSYMDISAISSRQKEDTDSTRSVNSQKSFHHGSLRSLGSTGSVCSGMGVVSYSVSPQVGESWAKTRKDNPNEIYKKGNNSTEPSSKIKFSNEPKNKGTDLKELSNEGTHSKEDNNNKGTDLKEQSNKGTDSKEHNNKGIDFSKMDDKTEKLGALHKEHNSTEHNKGNNSAESNLDVPKIEKGLTVSDQKRHELTDDGGGGKIDNSNSKGDNSAQGHSSIETVSKTNEQTKKKFYHGILLNDEDRVTKL